MKIKPLEKAKHPTQFTKKCLWCWKIIIALRKTKLFCCTQCRDWYRYIKREKTWSDVRCSYCWKNFYKPKSRLFLFKKHFCNKECMRLFMMKNNPIKCLVCWKEFYCSKSQQRDRHRKTCSIECRWILQTKLGKERQKISKEKRKVNRCIRYWKEMWEFRQFVFERDLYTCQKCWKRSNKKIRTYLNAHHILNFSSHEELRFEPSNWITFCKKCHKLFHKTYWNRNNNKQQITEFINEKSK